MLKRVLKIIRNTVIIITGLLLLLMLLVNLTPVQNFLARRATAILAHKLKTKVEIRHIRIDFLNHVLLQGLYIQDRAGDTLLYAGEARVRITDWFFLKKERPVIKYIGLHRTYGHLYRTASSDQWNYQFIIDAFDSGPKSTNQKQNDFELDLKKLDVSDTRFHMDDAWTGSDFDIDIGKVVINADDVDLKKKEAVIGKIAIEGVSVSIKDYDGGRPSRPKKVNNTMIDTTAFNTEGWLFSVQQLSLKDCGFQLNSSGRKPDEGEFDPEHIGISAIQIEAKDIAIVQDTIKGRINLLAAKERSGLQVKKMSADVTVSPNASVCDHLYLETNNSRLQHYYAMHYTRFPDFTEYVDKVIMSAELTNSHVDSRDIAYFAPVLRKYPTIIEVSGKIAGTVDSLNGANLAVTDGNTYIRGDITMLGLPDINTTFIRYQNGEIFTTNGYVFRYAPQLKNDPNIDLQQLTYAYYNGDFVGYIDNFAANGILKTNLGTIQSDIKLNIPDMNAKGAVYSGTLASSGFNIGALLRQPLLGNIALHANVSGKAFDPHAASVTINGKIDRMDLNGYSYKNINAEGVLAHKKFEGQVLVDDPNLALAFYGSIDFSQPQLHINATANLLQSDLQALHLTKDSILATADFDLNYIGNNIDDFSGYAKLYNINLIRNQHRLDIDSVYLNSAMEDGQKLLTVQSNDVEARIKGDYQLTNLPYSVQYYISGYLPNYIKAPVKNAPPQNLTFTVITKNIDSLLGVLTPKIRGFNNSQLTGTLNTSLQQLSLKGRVPYGYISGIHINDLNLNANGNFNQLALNAEIDKVTLGNNMLSASMSVGTQLGNDSLSFNISTTSDDAIGTANINGNAFARGDSLFLKLQPSEFYLNQNRWEIPSGNYFVFSGNYLLIKNLYLNSGLQQIAVATENESTTQSLNIDVKELDLFLLGNLAGLASYQPDGRINGGIKIDHLFSGLELRSNLIATNVKLGSDTIGTINLSGNYNERRKIITLDPQSGIFNGRATIRTAGSMSFDSTNRQLLHGYIQFSNAELVWLSPFVTGFLSNMKGTVDGTINIDGSALHPDVNGSLALNNAGTKIDLTGTYYTIPAATISIDNENIDFGKTILNDVYGNTATLTGGIKHERFRNMRFNRVQVTSPQFEVLNLKDYENNTFYGNLIANVASLTLSGTFDDIRMNIRAAPAARSHIYIPVKSTSDINSYSYVSFKSYGTEQVIKTQSKNKFSLTLTGDMNPLAEITLVLDPSTGDMINARGNGNITLNIPAGDDIKMYGNYDIDEGDYTFTFRQLYFKRNFIINSGSRIAFNGPINNTSLSINAVYTTKARLIDLLLDKEKSIIPDNELRDAKTAQNVNVLLYMTGSLSEPKLTFSIDLPEKRSEGTLAYQKLKRLNQSDRELFDQVASLLLINTFIPPEGVTGSTALSGGINNISEILSTTASSQLTNVVNKLLGDPNLAVELKYKNYNLSDPSIYGGINRNEVSVNVRKTLFKDRLIVELGSAYDWGRPTSASNSSSNLNLAGDFRVQYLLSEDGRVRLNAFRTSNFDVLINDNVYRGGVGISYRKTFNNFYELFHKKQMRRRPEEVQNDSTQVKGTL